MPRKTIEAIELIKKIRGRGITLIVVEHVHGGDHVHLRTVWVFDSGKKNREDTPEKKSSKTLRSSGVSGGGLHALR